VANWTDHSTITFNDEPVFVKGALLILSAGAAFAPWAQLSAQARANRPAHTAAWQPEAGRQAGYARRHGLAPGLFSL
jgi:hypothetical protein